MVTTSFTPADGSVRAYTATAGQDVPEKPMTRDELFLLLSQNDIPPEVMAQIQDAFDALPPADQKILLSGDKDKIDAWFQQFFTNASGQGKITPGSLLNNPLFALFVVLAKYFRETEAAFLKSFGMNNEAVKNQKIEAAGLKLDGAYAQWAFSLAGAALQIGTSAYFAKTITKDMPHGNPIYSPMGMSNIIQVFPQTGGLIQAIFEEEASVKMAHAESVEALNRLNSDELSELQQLFNQTLRSAAG